MKGVRPVPDQGSPMTRRDIVIKWTAYAAALILVAALEYYVLGPAPIPLPLLLPMAAVAVGTLEGPLSGAAGGAGAGLLMMGLGHEGAACVAACAAAGWLSGAVAQYVLRRDLLGHMICCAATALCWELWQVGSRLLSGAAALETLLGVAVPEFLWTVALAAPVYWIGRFCCVHYGRIYHE